MPRRDHVQAATTSAVSWSIFDGDDFDVERITLKWASAPTTPELVTVTKDSVEGAAYDTVLLSFDPLGCTSVAIENITGLKAGDKIVVAYTNTDAVSITGVATTQIGQDVIEGNIAYYLDGVRQDGESLRYKEYTLAAVTDGADDTYYYYVPMNGAGKVGLQLILNGGSGTCTATVEGTIQPGTALDSCTYADITQYGCKNMCGAAAASFTASTILETINPKQALTAIRVKIVASTGAADDADWTIYAKRMP